MWYYRRGSIIVCGGIIAMAVLSTWQYYRRGIIIDVAVLSRWRDYLCGGIITVAV